MTYAEHRAAPHITCGAALRVAPMQLNKRGVRSTPVPAGASLGRPGRYSRPARDALLV